MKKTLILVICLIAAAASIQAQVRIGIRAGVSTSDLNPDDIRIFDQGGLDRFNIALKDARYGVHGGLVIRARINKFVIQPEVIFNSNKVDYAVDDLQDPNSTTAIKTEKFQYLDIPLMMGAKFGPLRLLAGPVGHVFINNSSELTDIDGYEEKFQEFTFGYQAGLGLDLWKFTIDARYEGNFSKFGDHFTFFGNEYAFDQSPARFVLSAGFLFGKPDNR